MGPAAGLLLHRLIIENTKADKDQDHLRVVHVSFSDMIPDRTDSIMGGNPHLPADGMASAVLSAYDVCRKLNMTVVVGIPCNTFHAKPVWDSFISAVRQEAVNSERYGQVGSLKILNMVEQTIEQITARIQRGAKVGILSTTGSRTAGIYSKPLSEHGYMVLQPENQEQVHDIIYNPGWGLKAVPSVSKKAETALLSKIEILAGQGAEVVILGCTELPLAVKDEKLFGAMILDPMQILARALIKAADPAKIKSV